ncbi:lysophospholipid acyltransferase family protein [Niabella beijingensis]|uniref:lysophospholipid acyltransferase family protein n=1 Tax=Niabella beijingensis TaxID=2872700 RepID=UPI001CBB3979|nr:lysophospholipid acyltransferase family protein [Niabella beijingensis]MBZ4187393.1 1-acyl-sn-glycerol-3-phosphate acyltransferase [Niabella beijingensis]
MLRVLYTCYAAVIFLVVMLLIFPLCVIAAFFGRIRGGNIIYGLCTIWADLWFALTFIRVKRFYDAPFDTGKKYILIANHISYLDIPVMVKVFRKPMRALGKKEMGKIPLFGFIYKRAIVTVDRNSTEGRARSIRILRSVIQKGISIFVFPEGTFNETNQPLKAFYNGAFRLALETNTPIRPVLFLDTYDRMPYTRPFSLNPGKCRVIFMEEVPVEGWSVKDHEKLKQQVFSLMEQRLEASGASWIKHEKENQ